MFILSNREIRDTMASIRSNLNDLEGTNYITNPRSNTMSYFQRNGFCVFRNFLCPQHVHQNTVNKMKEDFEGSTFNIVFNDRPVRANTNRDTAERLQFLTKTFDRNHRGAFNNDAEALLEYAEYQTRKAATKFFAANSEIQTVETVLYSRANSNTIQNPHTDLSEEYVGDSMLAFVIIHPDTTLIIYPGSHNVTDSNRIRYRPQRFGFEIGDIVLFHPLLIHCGDYYAETNLRLHYYLFARPGLSWSNITFPVRDYVLRLIEWTNKERRATDAPVMARNVNRRRKEIRRGIRQLIIARVNNRRNLS